MGEDDNKVKDNDKYDIDDKGISALGRDRYLGFSLGYQEYRPYDDENKEDDNEAEDNNKDNDDDKSVSALRLYRDLGFSR